MSSGFIQKGPAPAGLCNSDKRREQRMSNFLPYQAAYAELYFTDTLGRILMRSGMRRPLGNTPGRNRTVLEESDVFYKGDDRGPVGCGGCCWALCYCMASIFKWR